MKSILSKLCGGDGISGCEEEMFSIACELLGKYTEVRQDINGNIIAEMGDKNADKHIMLDAHIDRIGLIVTYINDEGFIKAEPVGGIDLRTLQSSAVTVIGKEKILGVICTTPPHLSKDDEKLSCDKIWIDTGLPAEKIKKWVSLGDSIIVYSELRELLNDRIAVSALDNRAGCAVLIKCAELLSKKEIPCRLSIVLSAQEETNELGAKTSAFAISPDEAVIVDVGFAHQNGVPDEKSGALGCGGLITIAPALSRAVTDKLIEISKEMGLECDYEVCGGTTGTNADAIASARNGVACGIISIPERNMHTQVEVIDLKDAENIAQLLAKFVLGNGSDVQRQQPKSIWGGADNA